MGFFRRTDALDREMLDHCKHSIASAADEHDPSYFALTAWGRKSNQWDEDHLEMLLRPAAALAIPSRT
jgi:hypothetical protein